MTALFHTHRSHVRLLCVAGASASMFAACGTVEARQGTQAIAQGNSVACSQARDDLQKAVDAYTMLEQKPPADEAALVPGYLLAQSQLMDIGPDGKVVAAPGSGCP